MLSAVENVELPLLMLGNLLHKQEKLLMRHLLQLVWVIQQSLKWVVRRSATTCGNRYFVHSPSVIMCDEPTGNLDSGTSETVMQLLKSINKKLGTTFLLVTHDSDVAQQCSRILRMEDGQIVSDERGSEEE